MMYKVVPREVPADNTALEHLEKQLRSVGVEVLKRMRGRVVVETDAQTAAKLAFAIPGTQVELVDVFELTPSLDGTLAAWGEHRKRA